MSASGQCGRKAEHTDLGQDIKAISDLAKDDMLSCTPPAVKQAKFTVETILSLPCTHYTVYS